jgi:hypothetical protein
MELFIPGKPKHWGPAAIAISDRMITAGDVQYEPQQLKVATVYPASLVMIAGDYSLHTQAMKEMYGHLIGVTDAKPRDIALIYGRAIQGIKRRQAEDLFLAPLGLNTDSFLAQQKDMSEHFVKSITAQLQGYRGDDVEAIIVGSDKNIVQIYTVDSLGMVGCSDDVGFAAIGIGAWHAKSRLMQAGYVSRQLFANALAAAFAAKKSAETAPGVGRHRTRGRGVPAHRRTHRPRERQQLCYDWRCLQLHHGGEPHGYGIRCGNVQ